VRHIHRYDKEHDRERTVSAARSEATRRWRLVCFQVQSDDRDCPGRLPKRLHHHRADREDHIDIALDDFCHQWSDPGWIAVGGSLNNLDLLQAAVTSRA
jgi:hypothetical protein